ncbi:phosphoribosyltransferase family protein [Akkermansiaceae bacterium]|nr:phosphoribosyltransferase family protein [Akkermansiaceae bacterium]MDA7934246.1 phosphoribosyltransferase family protein [Akkermansiaceae bacterium]
MIGSSASAKTVCFEKDIGFFCCETGQALSEDIETFSRFKYGDVEAVRSLSKITASFFISLLENRGEFLAIFERAAADDSFVYLQSPGIRNVASASYHLMEAVASYVNPWLAINGFPTMIKKPITRLASGIPNYAQLSYSERKNRAKSTVSLLPSSDYVEYPIHVVFVDDVEVTGATKMRAQRSALEAGALSFSSIFCFKVESALAERNSSIENVLNQFTVKGNLDSEVASILKNIEYQPVQKMLRLLLNSSNRRNLETFVKKHISDSNLLRIYLAALSNDYHSITSNSEFLYLDSLNILKSILVEKKIINRSGLLM